MSKNIPEGKKELAIALLEAGKSYREVASALGISIGSVHNIMREPDEIILPLVEQVKKRLSARHYFLADYILSRISDLNMTYASLKDKVIASAILVEKARLIEGCSTNNLSCVQRGEGVKALKNRVEEMEKKLEHLNTPNEAKDIESKGENTKNEV